MFNSGVFLPFNKKNELNLKTKTPKIKFGVIKFKVFFLVKNHNDLIMYLHYADQNFLHSVFENKTNKSKEVT